MIIFHSFIDEILSLPLAKNLVLFYQGKRAAIRLQRINGPEHQLLYRSKSMPLIPNTVLIIFLQGGAL